MSLMTRFEHGAIRKGFILEEVSLKVLFLNVRTIPVRLKSFPNFGLAKIRAKEKKQE